MPNMGDQNVSLIGIVTCPPVGQRLEHPVGLSDLGSRQLVSQRSLGDCRTVLSVGTVVIGVDDLHRAVAFWTQALNYVPKRSINADDDFAILVPAVGEGTHLALDVSETPVQPQPRIHLDLYAGDAADQAAEVGRLVSLGATRVEWDRYPENPDFVVLSDTEGNRFCVIDTSQG